MTIKPVVCPATSKRAPSDSDKKENLPHGDQASGHSHSQQSVNGRNAATHSHRGVVLDRGPSPTRRNDVVFDELNRQRRSPHKSSRSKRREHHQRDRVPTGDKLTNASSSTSTGSCNSSHMHGALGVANSVNVNCGNDRNSPVAINGPLPNDLMPCGSKSQNSALTPLSPKTKHAAEEAYSGYNSGDEHYQPKESAISVDEWQRRDKQFEKCMSDRGYILKPVEEDGACLFRAISLQIYGDEEMHDVIRQHTMDYIYKNREYFCHFVTEDINSYIKRKRRKDSHGNHIEIQAMSEIYSRPVEVYCYKPTPINIFNSEQLNNGYAPLRLSYQRGSHYNAIIDPYNATVGVGLGLAGYKPELQTHDAARLSEQLEIEQTMFEDKLKTTDWEATNEAIEEQIARESYLQWCRENLRKSHSVATTTTTSSSSSSTSSSILSSSSSTSTSATVTSADMRASVAASSKDMKIIDKMTTASDGNDMITSTSANLAVFSSNDQLNDCIPSTNVGNNDVEIDSDDTDRSSTCSALSANNGDNNNNNNNTNNSSGENTGRVKKSKNRCIAGGLGVKKRRRDAVQQAAAAAAAAAVAAQCNQSNSKSDDTKLDSLSVTDKNNVAIDSKLPIGTTLAGKETTTNTLTKLKEQEGENIEPLQENATDVDQKPSTSKQSNHSPLDNKNKTKATTATMTLSSSSSTGNRQHNSEPLISSFYQELLEASYDASGLGQLSESEMLQKAIQMSTRDYIEDQKRKYLYGP